MNAAESREALLETARAMNAGGLNQGASGNVSLRLQDAMLITPSALPYHRCTPERSEEHTSELQSQIGRAHV